MNADVLIVGAGPAGLAAALAAAEAGARVVLLDEYGQLGGQFFKRASPAFNLTRAQLSREYAQGETLRKRIEQERIQVVSKAVVWGVFDRTVMVYRDGRSQAIRGKALILATGAYDRPVPYPGWTLPGAMSAGGAQSLARTQWVKPGQCMLLAGAGPFLLPVAQQLLRAGVKIAAILEATRPRDWLRGAPALRGQWPRFAEAWDYWRSLRRAGVPVLYRHKVVAAHGEDRLTAATVARIDAHWRAIPGSERRVEIDALATGYGFLPNIELADLMGCQLRWDPNAAAWFVVCDETMATSEAGVFAAGEITGIGGSAVALEEGRLAGIAAAQYAGTIAAATARSQSRNVRARLARRRRFAAMLNDVFAVRSGLWEGTTDDVVVCRCEEVTADEILFAVRQGCGGLKEIKDWTRAGMGLCQGRMCRAAIAHMIASEKNLSARDIDRPRVRPPLKPVPIRALAESELPEAGGS